MIPGPPRSGRRFHLALLLLAGSLLPAAGARAGSVVLLKSSALTPYNAAAQGFLAAYHSGALQLTLGEADDDSIKRRVGEAHPDVIVTVGLKATLFAREHFLRVPRVFCVVQNRDRYELSDEWSTGVSTDVPPEAELQALLAVAPDVKRVGLLYGRGNCQAMVRAARTAAAAAGIELVEAPVSDLKDVPAQARDLAAKVDALWMPPDPLIANHEAFRYLLRQSLDQRKPLLAFSEALVRVGALLAVSPDYNWVGGRVADAVRRIQAGERAGDIPVRPLKQTRMIVNLATSRALGRTLPGTLTGVETLP